MEEDFKIIVGVMIFLVLVNIAVSITSLLKMDKNEKFVKPTSSPNYYTQPPVIKSRLAQS